MHFVVFLSRVRKDVKYEDTARMWLAYLSLKAESRWEQLAWLNGKESANQNHVHIATTDTKSGPYQSFKEIVWHNSYLLSKQ